MKVVALIDCQNDFIDGTLGVGYDKWIKAYDYIEKNLLDLNKYDLFVFTEDDHPFNHCSFKEQGGIWPAHCVNGTEGNYFYWKLTQFYNHINNKKLIEKGRDPYKEEYGVDVLAGMKNVDEVNIAGLCTDYCVKESAIMTAKMHPNTKIKVHLNGSAFIAEDTLKAAIDEMNKFSNIEIIK